jgi:hypothetical protein
MVHTNVIAISAISIMILIFNNNFLNIYFFTYTIFFFFFFNIKIHYIILDTPSIFQCVHHTYEDTDILLYIYIILIIKNIYNSLDLKKNTNEFDSIMIIIWFSTLHITCSTVHMHVTYVYFLLSMIEISLATAYIKTLSLRIYWEVESYTFVYLISLITLYKNQNIFRSFIFYPYMFLKI